MSQAVQELQKEKRQIQLQVDQTKGQLSNLAKEVKLKQADISRKQFADIDEWQTQMQLKPMKAGSVHLYSGGLRAGDRGLTGVNLIDSVEEALHRCVEASGDMAVAVIPEGPYVVPVYQPARREMT